MTLLGRKRVRDAIAHYLKAAIFAVGGYLLIIAIYGGTRLSFFAWTGIVFLAFTIAYIPLFFRRRKTEQGKVEEIKESGDS